MLKPHPPQRLLHRLLELLRQERLGQMCVKSGGMASRDVSFGAKAGESDCWKLVSGLPEPLQKMFASAVGQPDITKQQIEALLFKTLASGSDIRNNRDVVSDATEIISQRFSRVVMVVNQQDLRSLRRAG